MIRVRKKHTFPNKIKKEKQKNYCTLSRFPLRLIANTLEHSSDDTYKNCLQEVQMRSTFSKQMTLTLRSSFNMASIQKLTKLKHLKTQENSVKGIDLREDQLTHKIKIIQLYRSGNFSNVYRAVMTTSTSKQVIVKKIKIDPYHISRQQHFAKTLKNPYIAKFIGTYKSFDFQVQNRHQETEDKFFHPSEHHRKKCQYLNIVMQKYGNNLSQVIQLENMQPSRLKIYLYQMLRSLVYIHSMGICHRDIKPHNFVIKNNRVFLIDFGGSKILHKQQKNMSYIFSREYRSPQLLFDCNVYDKSVDIWALGCVIAQIVLRKPIFNGTTNLDQIIKIVKVLGSPKWQLISFCKNKVPKIPSIEGAGLQQIFLDKCQSSLKKLISKMLKIEPLQRISAIQALCDPYFDQIREQSFYRSRLRFTNLPNFFYFQKRQIFGNQHYLQKLVPYWLKQHCKRFEVSLKDYKF